MKQGGPTFFFFCMGKFSYIPPPIFFCCFLVFFFFFCFLGLHLLHMEVPRPAVKLELQLLPYATATATATWDLSHVCTYTTAHGNAGSLTKSVRPEIEPVPSWIIVGFISTEPQQELQPAPFFRKALFFIITFSFYLSIVDLQYCVNFCCTAQGPSHIHTNILFLILSPIMFYSKRLDIVSCTAQQDIISSSLCCTVVYPL